MKTIYKYNLEIQDEVTLSIPGGFGDILHVGLDPNGNFSVWMLVDTAYEEKPFKLYIYGTGFVIPNNFVEHVGTIVGSYFVWHVFKDKD